MTRAALAVALALTAAPTVWSHSLAKSLEDKAVEIGPGIEPPSAGGVTVLPTPEEVAATRGHATVTVRLLIDKHGETRKASAVDAPDRLLGDAATAEFAQGTWRPAMQGGKPIAVWWTRKVRFRPKAELDAQNPPPDCVATAFDPLRAEELTDDVELPRLLQNATPEYPRDAMRDRDTGRAGVRCVLDSCGRVRDCSVMFAARASFGRATQAAAMQRRYAPARRNGQPVAIELTIVSTFYGP